MKSKNSMRQALLAAERKGYLHGLRIGLLRREDGGVIDEFLKCSGKGDPDAICSASRFWDSFQVWWSLNFPFKTIPTSTAFGRALAGRFFKWRRNGRIFYQGFHLEI
jgi:hypothetical protein